MDKDKLNMLGIEMGLDTDRRNLFTVLIDITAVIVNRRLKLRVSYSGSRFKSTTQNLLSNYIDTLSIILEKSNNSNDKEFTPSDFEAADISMEDLNSLFHGE
jgi:non-ribosomal peptide synthase protein (TIGR01720 family)